MYLREYIKSHCGTQRKFAKMQGVKPQQVTMWLKENCVVVDGVLYGRRRRIIQEASRHE